MRTQISQYILIGFLFHREKRKRPISQKDHIDKPFLNGTLLYSLFLKDRRIKSIKIFNRTVTEVNDSLKGNGQTAVLKKKWFND